MLMEISGVDEKTIRRGREELAASLVNRPADRVRQPGAGRLPVGKKTSLILSVLEESVAPNRRQPMTPQKWVRSSLRTSLLLTSLFLFRR